MKAKTNACNISNVTNPTLASSIRQVDKHESRGLFIAERESMIRQKGQRLWEPAVVAHLKKQSEPIDGRTILAETVMQYPKGTKKTLSQARSCPNLFQLARWANNEPSIKVTLIRIEGLTGSSKAVNHYEWVGE